MRSLALAFVLSMALLSTAALAEVPGLMNYQGTLTDGAGLALDTTVAMTFSIYDDSTAGTQLWTETQGSVEVTAGVFNVLLGSVTAIVDTVFNGPDRWLGMQVGGDAELIPRQRMASVGYAFVAGSSAAGADSDWTIAGDDIYSAVSGNVGIGDATPDCKLDVTGAINTDSVYSIGGTTVLSVEGSYNTLVGEDAGANVDDGYCTIVGYQAGFNGTGYGYNTFVGYQAGYNNGSMRNTFIGSKAGYANTSGLGNTFVGWSAGSSNTSGGGTFLGYAAGSSNTTGSGNTFLGDAAGNSNISGGWNTFVGYQAGFKNERGYNTFVGNNAGYDNTTGSENTFLGWYAGYENTTGSDNAFLGAQAGRWNTEGYSNTFVGHSVGIFNTTGYNNTFLGVDVGRYNTEGYGNAFVGMEAGHSNTTGYRNTALGWGAGHANSTGNNNVFLGWEAGYHETGSEKLYIANGPDTSDVLIHGDFATGQVGIPGKLAIGTMTPNTDLTIVNPYFPGFRMRNSNASMSLAIFQSSGIIELVTETSTILKIGSNFADNLILMPDGSVGIGNNNYPSVMLDVDGTASVQVLEITGGADLAEPFPTSSGEKIPMGSVVVIDVNNPGQLKISDRAYDTRVAGVVSGANGIKPGLTLTQEGSFESGQNVALGGRVYVQADASYGTIQPGDLLTTSDTPGHAMKVTDYSKASGTVLGKAMTALESGRGLVLVLVNLQ